MTATITTDSFLVRNPDLVATEMDGDTVMMSVARGEYYGLGGVGGRVWALLEQPQSMQALIHTICDEYDIEESQCKADLIQFAATLLENGVVTLTQ